LATENKTSETRSRVLFETLESPSDDRIKSSILVDLRQHPRFDSDFPAKAFTASGECGYGIITSISISGLRLEGSRQMVDTLFAKLSRLTTDWNSEVTLDVHFSVLTESGHLAPVKVHCKTAYTRHKEKGTYQIGMKFVFFEEGRAAITQYLSHRQAAR